MIKTYVHRYDRVCVDTLSAMLTQSAEKGGQGEADGGGLKRGGGRWQDERREDRSRKGGEGWMELTLNPGTI